MGRVKQSAKMTVRTAAKVSGNGSPRVLLLGSGNVRALVWQCLALLDCASPSNAYPLQLRSVSLEIGDESGVSECAICMLWTLISNL